MAKRKTGKIRGAGRTSENKVRPAPGFVRWIERTVQLPVGLSAEPGKITVPPYFREVACAMVDPKVEKITLMKSARLGFSTLRTSRIAYHMTEAPALPNASPSSLANWGAHSRVAQSFLNAAA
jgi:phage terminase large subunit GpA-like protein